LEWTVLAELLRTIHRLDDVQRLFMALSYHAADGRWEHGARIVARWEAFKVLAVADVESVAAARALASRIARSGERALAAALGGRALAIAAPQADRSTRALVVDLDRPSPVTLAQLEALRPPPGIGALRLALRIAETLSSEAVGERFFLAFRRSLDELAASLDARRSASDRRLVALLALTRILFLYFVQAKGWLDGRADYLRSLLDRSLGSNRNFHRSALHPLFFGTLNRPPDRRAGAAVPGRIPYLNGGLFEPHPVEHRLGLPGFTNALWRAAFDGVFERFRFCVREAHEVDAVAPDMLGRVFERLMEGEERERTGTFYTPESVVRPLVRATLTTALGSRGLPESQIRRLVAGQPVSPDVGERLRDELWRIRVLDPAVGSGAFLLGALDALVEMHTALGGHPDSSLRLKREILRRNLLGVDLNPVAVRLAELRLWLAVVSDDPTGDVFQVAPLPNLDAVVRQGDALFDPLGAVRAAGAGASGASRAGASRVSEARRAMFDATGERRAGIIRDLRREETTLARSLVSDALQAVERALGELDAIAHATDLFGGRPGLDAAQRSRHRALTAERVVLQRAARQIAHGVVPFFAFDVHAPDAIAAGGFTVVVGNPPWVRAERLTPPERQRLSRRFTWWRAGGRRGFRHLPDLAVAFVERALELAAPGGAVGLLVPSKVTSAGYAEAMRRGLVSDTTIAYLHRVPERDASAFGATTYPLALIVRKAAPESAGHVRLGFDGDERVSQSALGYDGPWVLAPDPAVRALADFLAAGVPLAECAPPRLGIKTGADRLLVGVVTGGDGDVSQVEFPCGIAPIERVVLRPAIRGRDARAWQPRPSRVVLWGYGPDGRRLTALPPLAAAHVGHHREALRRRSDHDGGPPWTLFRTAAATGRFRLIWADIARRPAAAVLEATEGARDAVPLNTCYVAFFDDEWRALAAAAVFNSRLAEVACTLTAAEARGGYRRVNASVAGRLPIPANRARALTLVDLSRRAHHGEPLSRDTLDDAVRDALDLPAATVAVLRGLAQHHG
jgi:hypothetical protein